MIEVTTPTNDGNRVEDSVTLTAHSGSVGNPKERASVTIKVADANEPPAVAMMVVDKDGEALAPGRIGTETRTSAGVLSLTIERIAVQCR